MDYFENLVKTVLEKKYFWVAQSVKINISKQEKRVLGKPSLPRPEIDILVYDVPTNRLIIVEVKSYLDSPGVSLDELQIEHEMMKGRYKLFTCTPYREVVTARLKTELVTKGFISSDTNVTLGLAAGKVAKSKDAELRTYLNSRGWMFWSPSDIREMVKSLASEGYHNDPYMMTAKVLTNEY